MHQVVNIGFGNAPGEISTQAAWWTLNSEGVLDDTDAGFFNKPP